MNKCARQCFGIAFAFIAFELALILFVDRPLSEYMRSLDAQNPGLIDVFRAYTDFGKSKWYLWPSGGGIIFCAALLRFFIIPPDARQRFAAAGNKLLFFFGCIALSGIITDIIKPLLGRARPVMLARENIYGFSPDNFQAVWNSMPSGHSTTAFALMASLTILYPRLRLLWVVVALILATSRIMVNAHYLSDVLAGAAVGILTVSVLKPYFMSGRIFPIQRWLFPIDRPKTDH